MSARRRRRSLRAAWRRVPWRRLWPRTHRGAGALAVVLLAALYWAFGASPTHAAIQWPQRQILDAIRWVESSDRDDVPDGDDGLAIGPYQIHRSYWLDAHTFDEDLGGTYQSCRNRAYAERVIDAYMRRYVPGAWQRGHAETIARVHNGGPQGHQRASTEGYWRRVRARLERGL